MYLLLFWALDQKVTESDLLAQEVIKRGTREARVLLQKDLEGNSYFFFPVISSSAPLMNQLIKPCFPMAIVGQS